MEFGKHIRSGVSALFVAGLVQLILVGCSKISAVPPSHYFGPETFEPAANVVIAPRFIRVSDFRVAEYPEYDAHVEVGVQGIEQSDKSVYCELVTAHKRFRTDRKWSPLPMAFYSVNAIGAGGTEDLNKLFQGTLTFENKVFSREKIEVDVTFTRGKIFRSQWEIYPLKTLVDDKEACTAVAVVKQSPQVKCHVEKCRAIELVAEVDKWRHVWQSGRPENQVDDVSSLKLQLEEVNSEGVPTGVYYIEEVPGFK